MVPVFPHVGFTSEILLPNQGFPTRFLVLQRRIYDGTLAAGPFPSQMYVVQMSQQYLRHEAFPKRHVNPSL